ncbi:Clp protease N-terminal domain-containing protein [Streptomyces sp. NPDC051105]|uniref:Clp protease N-terminal domain-containing protein n=1 Tax=Streptomyces sp. NPDC051105 TaxID=3154843 RepID=UPI003413CBFB
MYERFSDRAREVVDLAREEARALKHWYVESGHVLLALLAADETEVVGLLGTPAEGLRAALTAALGRGTAEPRDHLPLTGEAAAVFERAPREADRLGHRLVQPVHILLALQATAHTLPADILAYPQLAPEWIRAFLTAPEADSLPGSLTGDPAAHSLPGAVTRDPAAHSLLESLTRDPAADAMPVIGRATEIDRVLRTLTRRDRRVPLLTGPPGVGKEAVAVGVARAVGEGRVPDALLGRRVRALDLSAVLTDPHHRARGTALIADLLHEVRESTGVILYLNGALTPLHLPEGTTTPLGLLRPLLEAPDVLAFGDCGPRDYDRRDPDPGLDRLVQPVPLEEPPAADVREILRAGRAALAEHHAVTLTDEALAAAAALAHDHVPDRALPGSAFDLLDEAAALARAHAARADTPPDGPLTVTAAHVTQALAATSGIRTPAPTAQAGPPPGHDPYVWAMS